MNNKSRFKLFYQYRNLFIILSFVLLSILSTFLLIHSHFVGSGDDTYFHWQRIMELKSSFHYHHFFPQVALNKFASGGSAIMSFYPYFTLLPMLLLSYVIKSNINLIYFSFSLYTFITLVISYYSSLHINHRVDTSYLFSVMYALSTYMLSHGFQSMELGVLLSSVFLPLIIFGFIDFIYNNHWLMLSLGMTLIIFSHVFNSIFIFVLLVVWLLINMNKIDYNKIMSLIKAIILTLCTTAIFYVPFLKLVLLNKINNPILFTLNGHTFTDILNAAFNNSIGDNPGIFVILGAIIIPLLFYKKFNTIVKQMYWLSIGTLIIASQMFPWGLFQNSIIQLIQFPWRLYFIPQLTLTYIFALSITKYINKNITKTSIIGTLCFVILLQIGAQTQIINRSKNNPDITAPAKSDQELPNGSAFKMSTSQQVNNLSYGFSSTDYYPSQSTTWMNILRHEQGIYNINNYIQFYSLGNGNFKFHNNNKINELNAPFTTYNGIKYKAYLDNKSIPFKVNNTKLFTMNNVKKGTHHLQIKILPSISDVIIRILFFIGILIYAWLFLKKFMNKNKTYY